MTSSAAPKLAAASLPSQVPVTNVKSIVTSVGQLLLDYALQLRDDMDPSPTSGSPGFVKTEGAKSTFPMGDIKQNGAIADVTFAASSATEEPAQLTEADVMECRQRLQRLQSICCILQNADKLSAPRHRSDRQCSSSASLQREVTQSEECIKDHCETVRRNPVLTIVLSRFERMVLQFQGALNSTGVPSSSTRGTQTQTTPPSSLPPAAIHVHDSPSAAGIIKPLLTPVSLAEGALSAFSRNVGVVFRRRPIANANASVAPAIDNSQSGAQPKPSSPQHSSVGKRVREVDETTTDYPNHWARLASQQRKARFALYTLRSAVLPHVNRVCAPFYVSPAIRELAQLNAAAERSMLQWVWCVHTKAHLLREIPAVARDIEVNIQSLRDALKSFSLVEQDRYVRDVSYVQFLSTDSGILRLCVQHALFLDLTYDLRRNQWIVLELHWNLYTTAAGASLTSNALIIAIPAAKANVAEQKNIIACLDPCCAEEPFQQLQPENKEALSAFLQKSFLQSGLSGGLQAANRAVCAVVMDALATQLLQLQQTFFTGSGLARLVDVEVRPGTFISFHLLFSDVLNANNTTALHSGGDVVHAKITICGGTVMMERVQGTNLSTRRVTLLLGKLCLAQLPGTPYAGCPSHMMVDMEALLWQCLSAED